MKIIPLGKSGWVCWLDDEDFERFGQEPWFFLGSGSGENRLGYASKRKSQKGGAPQVWRHLHREIMDAPPDKDVDHIVHRCAERVVDNRRSNLRLCTRSQNLGNLRKRQGPHSSCFKGVTWDRSRGKWMGKTVLSGGKFIAKRFASETDAAVWYDQQVLARFGDFAKTNFLGPHAMFSSLPLSPSLDNSPEPW